MFTFLSAKIPQKGRPLLGKPDFHRHMIFINNIP